MSSTATGSGSSARTISSSIPDAWHSLKIFQERGEIRVYLGGIRVLSERDHLPRTPASVGLWTGGDSTVMFDDFRVEDETEDAPAGAPARTNKQ